MELTERQERILEIIKNNQPIRSRDIADILEISQATVRQDLSILTALGAVDAKPNVGYFFSKNKPYGKITREIGKISIKDIMSRPVIIDEETSVYDAAIKMIMEDCSTIFVLNQEEEKLIGLVSRKDLLKSTLQSTDVTKIPVGIIMTRHPLILAHADETVTQVTLKLSENHVDSLPVIEETVDGKQAVVGRISKTNITNKFAELMS